MTNDLLEAIKMIEEIPKMKQTIVSLQREVHILIETGGVKTQESMGTQKACKFLGCSRSTLYNYRKTGRLKDCNPGGHPKYKVLDLIRLRDSISNGNIT